MIEIFILSSIQGVTEFLPISSSSHLILISNFINFQMQSLVIDVSLHIGSWIKENLNNKQRIISAEKPEGFDLINVTIFHLNEDSNLIEKIRSIEIIGWTTLIFGILLYISDKFKLEKNLSLDFNYKVALIIGLFQILSLIPGVSRSGITITAGRFLGFKRFDASKISFLPVSTASLNSFIPLPSPLASSGSLLAPKRSKITRKIISSSPVPKLNII